MKSLTALLKQNDKLSIYLLTAIISAIGLFCLKLYGLSESLAYKWVLSFSIMLVLAYQRPGKIAQLTGLTLLASGIISQSWQYSHSALLIIMLAYIINAFNIAFQRKGYPFIYEELFHAVWETVIQLFYAAIFTVFCVALLSLAVKVFALAGLSILSKIIENLTFSASGMQFLFIIGLYIASLSSKIINQMRSILLHSCKIFLPILSVITAIYFVGVIANLAAKNPLNFNFYIYEAICLLGVLFINGVYQIGENNQPYRQVFTWIIDSFVLLMIPTALLGIYTLLTIPTLDAEPILKFGINQTNLGQLTLIGLLLCYAISYCLILLKNKTLWIRDIEKANIYLAYLFIAIVVLTNNYFVNMML